MVVKDNQPTVLTDLETLFARPPGPDQDLRTVQQVTNAHGRIEVRTLSASTDIKGYINWPGVEQGLRLERRVYYPASGKAFCEVDYGLLSLSPDQMAIDTILIRWREHWHIENKLHWVRDVVMGEDASRVRRDHAPQVLAALRNAVITLVKTFGFDSVTQARRHFALNFHEAASLVC